MCQGTEIFVVLVESGLGQLFSDTGKMRITKGRDDVVTVTLCP